MTKDEQINLNDADETLSITQSIMSLSTVASTALGPTASVTSTVPSGIPSGALDGRFLPSDEWEKIRAALYQQSDEKVTCRLVVSETRRTRFALRVRIKDDEINNLAQTIERLKSQTTDQDEVFSQAR